MAFFFLLHTPGPADLELRDKVGRTQTGSFWRLPIGRRTARVRRSGGVVRERRLGRWIGALASAINFIKRQCRAERRRSVGDGRRFALVVGSFSIAILASQLCVTPARAQQRPADFFEPAIAKKFAPGRKTPCAGCVQEQTALNKAWGDLNDFDKKTNGDFRSWYSAVNKLYDAYKVQDANAIKNAEGNIKAIGDKLNDKPAYQYKGLDGKTLHKTGELTSELEQIPVEFTHNPRA